MIATKKKLGLCTQSYKGKNEHFVGSYKENLDTLLVTYKENFGLGQTLTTGKWKVFKFLKFSKGYN